MNMTTEEKILQNFEFFYREWKEMDNFITKNEEDKISGMKEKIAELLKTENDNPEEIVKFVFDTRGYPALYGQQLERNKEELLAVYHLIEGLELEIPREIKTELEKLKEKKTKPIFKIEKGEPVPVDQKFIDEYLARLKSPQFLQQTINMIKNIENLGVKKEE